MGTSLLEKDLDTVTGAEWNAASKEERAGFIQRHRENGMVAFLCLACGFPVAYGGAPCEACDLREND